jgi:hypothetical protein
MDGVLQCCSPIYVESTFFVIVKIIFFLKLFMQSAIRNPKIRLTISLAAPFLLE